MASTRVVLAALPTMLADIVRDTLVPRVDLEIVCEVADRLELAPALARTGATLAIVGIAAGEERASLAELLRAHPHVRLRVIRTDGREAFLYELRLEMSTIAELSPRDLLHALPDARLPGM